MSRIIVSRHPSGEESVVVGFDRPTQEFFGDLYDQEGEYVGGVGLLGEYAVSCPEDVVEWLERAAGVAVDADRVQQLLEQHMELEYPASNVVVDLSREGAA